MASAPGIEFVPVREQQLFALEFQKDVEFLELLILMISKSCATGSVDITWVNGQESVRQVIGTSQASRSACSRYLNWDRQDASQRFCNIVSDSGRRAAESCAVCENAAEKRVGETGRAQVYRCHAGLTDIAVPVIAEGRHIATLYSGQVLTQTPSQQGFEQVARDVRNLGYLDLQELEDAYWNVPVVSEDDIAKTVHILESVAEFLARFWNRLGHTVRAERRKVRDIQLASKEFAYLILQPEAEDRTRLCELMKELGFVQPPNRMMVVELPGEEEFESPAVSFDLVFTTALQAVEEVAERTKNASVAYLRRRGVCVFFRDLTEGPSAGLRARSLADKFLYEISSRCSIRARIGVGGLKPDWRQLAQSYHEARLALAKSDDVIVFSSQSSAALSELTAQTELACQMLANQRLKDAKLALRALPMLAHSILGDTALNDHRNFFCSALESFCFTALKAGCDTESIVAVRTAGFTELGNAGSVFEIQGIFLDVAENIAGEVGRLLTGKHEKVIARVQQMLDRRLKEGRQREMLSLSDAARALGISAGHLSRTFRGVTGMTFRDYVVERRVEYARRLLLDPLNNVSTVAERCGFSSASYFARVFRKVVGCTPMAYVADPKNWPARAPASDRRLLAAASSETRTG